MARRKSAKRIERTLELDLRLVGPGTTWTEHYNPDDLVNPSAGSTRKALAAPRIGVRTQEEAEQWGREIVEWYNQGQPAAGPHREFVACRLKEHTNGQD